MCWKWLPESEEKLPDYSATSVKSTPRWAPRGILSTLPQFKILAWNVYACVVGGLMYSSYWSKIFALSFYFFGPTKIETKCLKRAERKLFWGISMDLNCWFQTLILKLEGMILNYTAIKGIRMTYLCFVRYMHAPLRSPKNRGHPEKSWSPKKTVVTQKTMAS